MGKRRQKRSGMSKIMTGIGYVICLVLALIFVINVTMIVKSYTKPDQVPDFIGYKPFIVLSGSMEPAIMTGDLIVTKEVDPKTLKVGDIISFRVNSNVVVSHRITEIDNTDGLSFQTKGDANVGSDAIKVLSDDVEGIYIWRGAGLGRFAVFLQTPIGMLVFVVTPLCLFIIYDIVSRGRRRKKQGDREARLEAELAALKAGQKEAENSGSSEEKN